jgi:hypothetical protein
VLLSQLTQPFEPDRLIEDLAVEEAQCKRLTLASDLFNLMSFPDP